MNALNAPARRTLVLGGTRSGKSRLAEGLAAETALSVVYVATALPGDDAMRARIAAHQERRPADWLLIEEPLALASALTAAAAPDRCLLVDCLTLWLTNLLMKEDDMATRHETDALLTALDTLPGRLILVSNETGLGILPLGDLTRRYCDLAGALHQALATRCERVILTVAGLPLLLKGVAP